MKRRKEDYLLIGFAVILVIIVVSISIITFRQANAPSTTVVVPTVTPIPTVAPKTNPPVTYDTTAQKKLLDKVLNRVQLTKSDAEVKQNILSQLPTGQQSGTLYSTDNVEILYISGPDLFQAEILTTNVAQAKADANIWFRNQGMSQPGICNLPLMFYLNWNVANLLKDTHITFSPLPNGC